MPKKLVFGQTALPDTPKPASPPPAPANTKPSSFAFAQTILPDAPKPAPVAPKGPTSFTMAGQTKISDLDAMVNAAKAIDPIVAMDNMFIPRLRLCAGLKPLDWMNWANDRLEILRTAASAQVNVNLAVNALDVAKWCDDAREQAQKKPGFLDMFQAKVDPEFYDAQLNRIRGELRSLADVVNKAVEDLRPKMQQLMVDNVVFQVVSKMHTDPGATQIAHGRLTTILSGLQMGALAEQSLLTTLSTIATNIQTIDTVQQNVIPAWRIASAAQKKP